MDDWQSQREWKYLNKFQNNQTRPKPEALSSLVEFELDSRALCFIQGAAIKKHTVWVS